MAADDTTSGRQGLELAHLPEGTTVHLKTGARAEVIGNPGDGAWLLVRIVEAADDPSAVGREEMVFFTDVEGAR
jgi:hypothetical protein